MNKWGQCMIFALVGLVIPLLPVLFFFPVVVFALPIVLVVGVVVALIIGLTKKKWLGALGFLVGWTGGTFLSSTLAKDTPSKS
ncbi:hypothetical protein IMZ31_19890 (plasmid) [Pontibacillus sp. ALD_SL1]|uniref:hypothetical protein n=1 Tax=Pontibacillus sp. ALD_SL1 TaxID=2777185 RepID=UPI001A97B23E|nr:hypothetical protein [Pontibacillus sp. ALD_SL1]QST02814.1 hypothetical protein IMZ31_19890 [Pontibacillus sp. ALD_SL1]